MVFVEGVVGALETDEDEAAGAQYVRLKKVADSVGGGGTCVFRSVYVGASVDTVVVLQSGPVEMPAVLVVLELAWYAARMTTWLLE